MKIFFFNIYSSLIAQTSPSQPRVKLFVKTTRNERVSIGSVLHLSQTGSKKSFSCMRQDLSSILHIASIVSIHTASYQYILTSLSYLIQISIEFTYRSKSVAVAMEMPNAGTCRFTQPKDNNLVLSFSSLRERVSFDKK